MCTGSNLGRREDPEVQLKVGKYSVWEALETEP